MVACGPSQREGLVGSWQETKNWTASAKEVAPHCDFRAECEKYRDYPKDVFRT